MSKQYLTAHVEDAQNLEVYDLAITPSYVITVSSDSNVKLWGTGSRDHPLVHQFSHAHPLGAHHVAAAGKLAATAGFGGEIILWDLEKLKEIDRIKSENGRGAWALALSAQGDRLAATSFDGRITTWDTSNPRKILTQYAATGSFGVAVDMSPDGNLIASGHANGSVYMFNNTTTKIHHSLRGLVGAVRCVRFSPGGKLLAACGDATIVALFNVHSGDLVRYLGGHLSWVFSVAFSPVGDCLISGSLDGKLKVWMVETGSCVATQSEATAAVHRVHSIPRGTGIGEGFVAARSDGHIDYYRETTGE